MPTHMLKADFSRGEGTPLVSARQDSEFYAAMLAYVSNFAVLRYGGLRRCSGTKYHGTAKFSDRRSRFIPFIFSDEQAFVLEFGDTYVRFWTVDGTIILSGPTPYEIVTPYAPTDLDRVQFVQFGDTIFLTHPDYPPAQIKRISNTNWTYSQISFVDGPYLTVNDTAVTVTSSATPTVGSRTFTWSNVSAINDGAGFSADDVGRHVRVAMGNNWAWGTITSVTSSTVVVVNVIESAITANSATATWRLGMQCASQGYFGSVAFYKGRSAWARTDTETRTVAFSMSNLPYRHSPTAYASGTVTDDHGFTVPILSGRADEILWLQEQSSLQIGTASHIRTIRPDDSSGAFGPRNYIERAEVSSGSAVVQPVPMDTSTVHCARFGLGLNDCFFDYQVEGLVAPPISTLAEHLLRSGAKALAYAQSPTSTLWVVTEDGKLTGITYDRSEKIVGFYRRDVAGGVDTVVESIAVVPDATNKMDKVFLIVRRTINAATVRYVESLQPEFIDRTLTTKDDAWFVDCGLRYEGTAVNVVAGLDHLKGATVWVFADGAVYPDRVVSQTGTVTLPVTRTASKILVGLPLVARAEGLRVPMANSRDGAQLGLRKRVPYAVLDLYETGGVKIGSMSKGKAEHVLLRKPSDVMGTAPELFTGTVTVTIEDAWNNEGRLFIECDQPLPATILAVNIGVETQP